MERGRDRRQEEKERERDKKIETGDRDRNRETVIERPEERYRKRGTGIECKEGTDR